MAEVYAPKVDLVGRGVYEADLTLLDNLIRAALGGESEVYAQDMRIGQLLADLDGDLALAATLWAEYHVAAEPMEGQSALSVHGLGSDFGAHLTGTGRIITEAARSHLSGAGEVQAALTGGQGVVFATHHLRGSSAVQATLAPLDHSIGADLTTRGHLGLVGDVNHVLDPQTLTADGTLASDATYVPGYDSRVTQLTGESRLQTRVRKDIPFGADLTGFANFGDVRKTVLAAGTAVQTSSASVEPETLTVARSGPHEEMEGPYTGGDDLTLASSTVRRSLAEPSVAPAATALSLSSSTSRTSADEPNAEGFHLNEVDDQTATEGDVLA